MGKLTRREILQVVAAGGALATFPLSGVARAQAPQSGGILRLSYNTTFKTISPIKALSNPEFLATGWMYNNLTKLGRDRVPGPDLAESWEPKNDAKQWDFTLRQGVKFHNGRELTADDVAASFAAVLNPENASPNRTELGPIDKVEATGKYSVSFKLRSAYADLPASLSVASGRVIAQEGLSNLDALANSDFGTGPFKLAEFVPGDRIVVERFSDYYKAGKPFLDGAIIKTYPEAAVEVNALRSRETDFIVDVAPEFFGQLSNASGIDAMNAGSGTFAAIVVPCDKPPFNDVRVREALKLTLDRDTLLAGAFEGYGKPAFDQPLSAAYALNPAVDPRKQDIEKAKALLAEAGYPDGLPFTLYVPANPPLRERIAVIVKEMASAAGIDIKIEVVSYDRFLSQIWNKAVPYVVYYSTRPSADMILKKLYHPVEGVDEGRWGGQNPKVVEMLDRAGVSVDMEERQKLYAEICKISRDEGPYLIPFFKDELSAKAEYVRDYVPRAVSFEVDIEDVWLLPDAPGRRA